MIMAMGLRVGKGVGLVAGFRVDGFLQFEGTVGQEAGRDEEDECHGRSFVKFAFSNAGRVPSFEKDS
jgi:hypothetical protein